MRSEVLLFPEFINRGSTFSIELYHYIFFGDFIFPKEMKGTLFNRDLGPKTHLCFYGKILMTLWKKNFVQFVVL